MPLVACKDQTVFGVNSRETPMHVRIPPKKIIVKNVRAEISVYVF